MDRTRLAKVPPVAPTARFSSSVSVHSTWNMGSREVDELLLRLWLCCGDPPLLGGDDDTGEAGNDDDDDDDEGELDNTAAAPAGDDDDDADVVPVVLPSPPLPRPSLS